MPKESRGVAKHKSTRGGTRTRNLLLRREAPYPLGHTSNWLSGQTSLMLLIALSFWLSLVLLLSLLALLMALGELLSWSGPSRAKVSHFCFLWSAPH